jgi:hypothetical protein
MRRNPRRFWKKKSIKELRNKKIRMVKISWEHYGIQDETWKIEDWMRKKYPKLF